ncbi:hypothetical protein B0H13DRAFT_1648725, partial [Mycena leptocephala]
DTVDDHWGYWNWQKLISLGAFTLRRRLDNALEQEIVLAEALESFSEQQKDRVDEWKKMVHDYEEDSTKKNPYEAVVSGLSEAQVRLQFQQEEQEEARQGVPAKHKVSPSTFMAECLDVEDEQCLCAGRAEEGEDHGPADDLSALQRKLIRRLERLRKLQGTYSLASIVALEARNAPADELPENEPLFLPSVLSAAARETGCTKGLLEMELLMRDAQCRSALIQLRNQLHIKSRYLNYKKLHTRHQGANTRAPTIVHRNETKIRLHSEKYQAVWGAMVAAESGDKSKVGWRKLKKEDIRYGGCGGLGEKGEEEEEGDAEEEEKAR